MNKTFFSAIFIHSHIKYNFSKVLSQGNIMAKASLGKVKENAEVAKKTIHQLKEELNSMTSQYNNMLAEQLREENTRLMVAVENAKNRLIQLEIQNGVPQIPLPNQSKSCSTHTETVTAPKEQQNQTKVTIEKNPDKPQKAKKEKKEKAPKEAANEPPVDIGRLDLRIAQVEDVQRHPDADSLYVLKINCGEDKSRTVCSGLVKHVPIEELHNRSVVLLCNLKPVKMRGITSEAMVMCASSEQGVEVLAPPEGCSPGTPVICGEYTRQPDAVMNPKKKIFETVAPDLHTNGSLEACYKDTPLEVEGKGRIKSKTLANVPVK